MTTTSTRPVPMLLGAGRYWNRRASSCVTEFWQPAHPPVSCAFVSKGLFVGFPVLDRFSGLIGEAQYLDAADLLTENTQALLEFVAWCGVSKGNQASTIAVN